jgi:hypothetical protein
MRLATSLVAAVVRRDEERFEDLPSSLHRLVKAKPLASLLRVRAAAGADTR